MEYRTHDISLLLYLLEVYGNWLDPNKVRRMTVVGSKKMIVYDDVTDEGKIKVYDKGFYRKRDDIYGDIFIPKMDMTEPLRNEYAHFIECVQQNRQPLTDGENGLWVVRVQGVAKISLKNHGMPVALTMRICKEA